MSKSYVAYPWTHRSTFQKTETFRRIDLKDCVLTGTSVVSRDSDDEQSNTVRATKRRRIEAAAQRVIDGAPLLVTSVRPSPHFWRSVKTWVTSTNSTVELSDYPLDRTKDSNAVWVEAEDDQELLQRLTLRLAKGRRMFHPTQQCSTSVTLDATEPSSRSTMQSRATASKASNGRSERRSGVSGAKEIVEMLRDKQESRRARSHVSRSKKKAHSGPHQGQAMTPVEEASYVNRRFDPAQEHDVQNYGALADGEQTDKASNEKALYQTAPEDCEMSQKCAVNCDGSDLDGGERDLLELTPGGSASNDHSSKAPDVYEDRHSASTRSSHTPVSPNVKRHVSCGGAERLTYVTAQPSQVGSTPFLFRKATIRLYGRDDGRQQDAVEKSSKGRRKTLFSSVNSPADTANVPDTAGAGRHLDNSLAETHLNTVLPTDAQESRNCFAIRKAIRRELRNSGAEITRCASEQCSSPVARVGQNEVQRTPSHDNSEACESIIAEGLSNEIVPLQTWPGTQMMLARAQDDLIASPEKESEPVAAARTWSQGSNRQEWTAINGRRVSTLPSARDLPSTQILLNDFAGFSTTKKPRQASRKSTEPTPIARKSSTRRERTESSRNTGMLFGDAKSRSDSGVSNLRFATSSHDPPTIPNPDCTALAITSAMQNSGKNDFMRDDASTPFGPRSNSYDQQLDTAYPTSSVGQDRFEPAALVSLQAAQRLSSLPLDDGSIGQVIDDLTLTLLDTGDVDGVLSPVGSALR